jgi:uncharacterized membrane protein
LIALAALFLWVAIVLIEVKVREFWFLKYVFSSSLLLLFIAFPVASLVALKEKPRLRSIMAVVSFLCITPAFIVTGVMAVWFFKMAIGGGIS